MSDSDSRWERWVKEGLGFILLVFVPLAALCGFVCAQVFHPMWRAAPFFLGPLLLPPILYLARRRSSFTAAVAVLIPLEVLSAFLASYTLLGVSSALVLLLVWVNVIPVGLHFLRPRSVQLVSWVLLGGLALGILLPQMREGICLLKLKAEAEGIIVYCYDGKLRTGAFPADLSAYAWKHADLRSHFDFYGHAADDKFTYPFKEEPPYDRSDRFSFRLFVGNEATAYWYSSGRGWFVEDD